MSPNPQAVLARLQKALASTVMVSGMSLCGLFAAALFGFEQPVFQLLWNLHLFVHLAALAISVTLLVHLARELNTGSTGLYLCLFFTACAIIVCSTFLPWTSFHAVSVELPLARWWIQSGAMSDIPWFQSASLPGGIIPVYAGFFTHRLSFLLSAYVASYVLILAGLLAALVFYKTHDEELSLWACLLLMTNPFVVASAGQPSNVFPAAVFFGLAYGMAILWGEQRARWIWLLIPGLSLGFACFLSAESIVLSVGLLLGLFGFYLGWKFSLSRASAAVICISIAAVIGASLWLFRSFLWSGRPLHSFSRTPDAFQDVPPFVPEWGLGFLFLFFALIPLFRRSRNLHRIAPWGRSTWFIAVNGAFLSWLYYSKDLEEILIPLLLPMILLASAGIEQLIERKQANRGMSYMRGFLVVHFCLVIASAVWSGSLERSLLYLFGKVSKVNYLEEAMEGYSVTRAANRSLPATSGVFLVRANLPLYYLKKRVTGISRDGEFLSDLLEGEAAPHDFARRLLLQGTTHILIGSPPAGDMKLRDLTPHQSEIWRTFLRDSTARVWQVDGHSLLKIESSAVP